MGQPSRVNDFNWSIGKGLSARMWVVVLLARVDILFYHVISSSLRRVELEIEIESEHTRQK